MLFTTAESQTSAAVVRMNPAMPIVRGGYFLYRRTTSTAVKNTVRLNGIIASDVSKGVRPCTIWMYSGIEKFTQASRATTMNIA